MLILKPILVEVDLPGGTKGFVRTFSQDQLVRVMRDPAYAEIDRKIAADLLKYRAETGHARVRLV